MDDGAVMASGSSRCSAPSTDCKSSSKNAGRLIWEAVSRTRMLVSTSRFALAFRIEWLCHQFAVGLLQQNFHFAFGFFQLFLAFAGQRHALFKQLHRFVQRQ